MAALCLVAACPDPTPPRELTAEVVLGEGGFFGVSAAPLAGTPWFAVGAHYAEVDGEPSGRVYLFERGEVPASADEAVATLVAPDQAPYGGFGWSLAGPCDLDGDERVDLVVGNHLYSRAGADFSGRAVAFWGEDWGGGTAHALEPGLTERNDVFGQTVRCADLDGDGLDDLVTSGQNAGADRTGLVAVFWGDSGGLAPTQDLMVVPPVLESQQYFGASTAWVDVDGDEAEELLVGGWGLVSSAGAAHTGGVLVFEASLGSPAWSLFPQGDEQEQLGLAMAVGEVDGEPMLAVGAPAAGEEGDGSSTGRVYVYQLGSVDWADQEPLVLEAPAGWREVGFAQALGWVEDYGPTGGPALLVGAKHADCTEEETGTGAVAAFTWVDGVLSDPPEVLCAPEPASNDAFGGSVVDLGDLDGDGRGDFLVGLEGHVEGDLATGVQTGGVVIFH